MSRRAWRVLEEQEEEERRYHREERVGQGQRRMAERLQLLLVSK